MNYKNIICFLLLFSLLLCGCNSSSDKTGTSSNSTKTIYVYWYDDFPKEMADNAIKKLKKVYPIDHIIVKGRMGVPDFTVYNSKTNGSKRLWAPSLLKYQQGLQKDKKCIVLAFTTRDIASKVGNHKDWGVFGLGSKFYGSCVCSTFRMKGKRQSEQKESFAKLMLHELGHCFGLPHCKRDSTCYISDAEGKYHLKRLKGFCPYCKIELNKRGWKLK